VEGSDLGCRRLSEKIFRIGLAHRPIFGSKLAMLECY